MFKGIAGQITKARIEVIRQGLLSNYLESLIKEQKSDKRSGKKITTALSKQSFSDFDINKTALYPGLKSLFFAVFGKQENENDSARRKYLKDYLRVNLLEKSEKEISSIIESIGQHTESKRTINDLERLIQRINQNTKHKYPIQEVSVMLQYILKSSEIEARSWQLGFIMQLGKTIQDLLLKIIKNLRKEENWGSWELYHSGKSNLMEIKSPGIDSALSQVAKADALSRAFSILTSTFIFNRNLESHHRILTDYKELFVKALLYDWTEGSGPKTAISKTTQLAGSITAIIYTLKERAQKNMAEKELMNKEKETFIKKAENIIQKKQGRKIN